MEITHKNNNIFKSEIVPIENYTINHFEEFKNETNNKFKNMEENSKSIYNELIDLKKNITINNIVRNNDIKEISHQICSVSRLLAKQAELLNSLEECMRELTGISKQSLNNQNRFNYVINQRIDFNNDRIEHLKEYINLPWYKKLFHKII